MTQITIQSKKINGTVHVPPSKSMAHRAIICASLAKGRSTITHIDYSKDIEATIEAMKALGTIIIKHDDYLEIDGMTTFMKNKIDIDCCESGSTLRFMIPLSIAYASQAHFTGEGRLGERPLDIYYDIFDRQGVAYLYQENVLDLYIKGKLKADEFHMPGDVSSQFISGLMFALPLMEEDSKIIMTSTLESKGYIDLTIQMLNLYGIEIINHDYKEFIILGQQQYIAKDYHVEADFSQAAFYLCAGALGNDVVLKGLNLDSFQGDKVVIDILKKMGCKLLEVKDGHIIKADNLKAVDFDGSQCPDIIPVLSLVCALSEGTSTISSLARLRIKECDRLTASVEVINQLGGSAQVQGDDMVIEGVKELQGGSVSSYNDHRMAMMEAIASTVCKNQILIDNKECVAKSYPNFWEDFRQLGGDFK